MEHGLLNNSFTLSTPRNGRGFVPPAGQVADFPRIRGAATGRASVSALPYKHRTTRFGAGVIGGAPSNGLSTAELRDIVMDVLG